MQDYETWKRAEIAHNNERFDEASVHYNRLLNSPFYFLDAHIRIATLQPLNNAHSTPLLVWRVAERFPIVRQALKYIDFSEEVIEYDSNLRFGHKYERLANRMVCVDWRLSDPQSLNYYISARRSGCQMVLIHLSDENFMDYHSLYPLFRRVFRQYAGELVLAYKNVDLFPCAGADLSWSNCKIAPQANPAARRYSWNFIGDDTKNDRREAINTFKTIPNNFLYTVSDFFDERKLPKIDYLEALSQSVFTLCPMGYTHVETMRYWEALECGSIPIFAHPERSDYYSKYFGCGKYPIPVFKSWADARTYVTNLLNHPDELLQASVSSQTWWRLQKTRLARNVQVTLGKAWA